MLFLSHGPLLSRKFQTYHKTLHDAEVVMDDLGQGRQAVSSARGIAVEEKEEGSSARGIYRGDMRPPIHLPFSLPDNFQRLVILFMVDTHHKHGSIS